MGRSGLMFLVLAICGTLCILGGLIVASIMVYPSIPRVLTEARPETIFSLAFLGICPSFVTIVLGAALLLMAIRIGRKGDAP